MTHMPFLSQVTKTDPHPPKQVLRLLSAAAPGAEARGPGTLIPSAQRLVWAAQQPLGKAALGALFA